MAAQEGSILPLEMLQEVFSYLKMEELDTIVAPVCRLWRDASRLPVLRRRLTVTSEIPPRAARAMLRRSPLLTELRIDAETEYSTADTDKLLRTAAAHNRKLRVLKVDGPVSDIGVKAVAQCDELRTLSIRYTSEVTDDGFLHLARLSLLEDLELWAVNGVTDAGYRRLFSTCEWPHLRELILSLDPAERNLPQVTFQRLQPTLRSIDLCGSMSDDVLEAVVQCDQLRVLTLDLINGITDVDVVHGLARLRHLEKLEVRDVNSAPPLGWRYLFSICKWPHLRQLNLSFYFGIDEGDMEDLRRQAGLLCPNVTIRFC